MKTAIGDVSPVVDRRLRLANPAAISLYPYQQEAVSFLKKRGGSAGVFMGMGTGKTRTTLAYLNDAGAKLILIVCPLSAVGVWRDEIRKTGIGWKTLRLAEGSIPERARILGRIPKSNRPIAVLINYAAFWRSHCRRCGKESTARVHTNTKAKEHHAFSESKDSMSRTIMRLKPDSIVIDEAHRIKNRTSKQARFAHKLADKSWVKRKLALTGSLADDKSDDKFSGGCQVEDLFSIYRFIDVSVFGKSWTDFDHRYIIRGGFGGYQIKGYRYMSEINRKLASSAVSTSKGDALNLPKRVTQIVPVKLSARAQKLYNDMKRNSYVTVTTKDQAGKEQRGRAVAQIVLTEMVRLQQIACGFLPVEYGHDEGEILDLGNDKLNVAVDLTSDAIANGKKVVIFCRFIPDLKKLKQALPKAGVIAGNIPADARDHVVKRLHSGDINVVLVQIATGSESIDLTPASVAIFYSVDFSLLEFNQARDRLHRHGQTNRVLEYLLVAEKIDQVIYSTLTKKRDISRQVTSREFVEKVFA